MVLEKAMGPHSSTPAWKIPWTEEPGRLQSMGSLRVGHDWAISLSLFTFMHWRRKWQLTPVFLPGEFQGRGILVGCCLWGHTELDDRSDFAAAAAWYRGTKFATQSVSGMQIILSWKQSRPKTRWKKSDLPPSCLKNLCSMAKLCVILCNSMDCSTSMDFPAHQQLPEPTQTNVHWVSDAIQPSHPLSSSSPPTFSQSQHQGLFKWVSSLHQVAKILEFQLKLSVLSMNIQDWFPSG